jgi:hypothetical protein
MRATYPIRDFPSSPSTKDDSCQATRVRETFLLNRIPLSKVRLDIAYRLYRYRYRLYRLYRYNRDADQEIPILLLICRSENTDIVDMQI